MTPPNRQLILDLAHRPALGRGEFMVSEANARALATVEDWRAWPAGRLALIGPARAGKTHLAHVWMQETGATLCAAVDLSLADAEGLAAHGRVVVEDADRLAGLSGTARRDAEDALFHLHNLMEAERGALLVTGREAPARWPTLRRDLASRLAALAVATIALPDDALLSFVLVKLFADRQIQVSPDVINYVIRHMDRSFEAAEDIVIRLDRAALAHKSKVSRALAAELLSRSDAGRRD